MTTACGSGRGPGRGRWVSWENKEAWGREKPYDGELVVADWPVDVRRHLESRWRVAVRASAGLLGAQSKTWDGEKRRSGIGDSLKLCSRGQRWLHPTRS